MGNNSQLRVFSAPTLKGERLCEVECRNAQVSLGLCAIRVGVDGVSSVRRPVQDAVAIRASISNGLHSPCLAPFGLSGDSGTETPAGGGVQVSGERPDSGISLACTDPSSPLGLVSPAAPTDWLVICRNLWL